MNTQDKLLPNANPRDDQENDRPATGGECEFYSIPTEYDANRPRSGPLAGLDLVHYMRTGEKRRLDRYVTRLVAPRLPSNVDEKVTG